MDNSEIEDSIFYVKNLKTRINIIKYSILYFIFT